jgi:hypothetical protein
MQWVVSCPHNCHRYMYLANYLLLFWYEKFRLRALLHIRIQVLGSDECPFWTVRWPETCNDSCSSLRNFVKDRVLQPYQEGYINAKRKVNRVKTADPYSHNSLNTSKTHTNFGFWNIVSSFTGAGSILFVFENTEDPRDAVCQTGPSPGLPHGVWVKCRSSIYPVILLIATTWLIASGR